MSTIGYYKSCSLHASSKDYSRSLEAVFARLSVKLVTIDDWNCCGASSAHSADEVLGLALPARNLARAEAQGLTTLLVPCSACYTRMLQTAERMRTDERIAQEINDVIRPSRYLGTVQVKNILEVLWTEVGLSRILRAATKNLRGMRLACYYGCYLTRTPRVESFDDRENPQSMERLLRALGADPVDWPYKTDCCGAAFAISEQDLSTTLCDKLFDMARKVGAEALVATCPLCHTNLDLNQDKLKVEKGRHYGLPVFYITDLLGIALGCDLGRKQWRSRFIPPQGLLARYALE
jgi:heterodisulfide reductase subunit B